MIRNAFLVILIAIFTSSCTTAQYTYVKTGVKGLYYAYKAKQLVKSTQIEDSDLGGSKENGDEQR